MNARRWPAVAIFLTNISLQITIVTAFVCGPTFQRLFSLSQTQLGVSLGATNVGVLAMSLLVGHITYRFGPFHVLVWGLATAISGLTLILFATGFWSLLGSLALIGLASGIIRNANNTFLADLFHDKLRQIMALAAGLWFSSSVISAPAIGAWLDAAQKHGLDVWSFRLPYAINILLIGTCLILVASYLRPTAEKLRQHNPAGQHNPDPPDCEQRRGATLPRRISNANRDTLWIVLLGFCHGWMVICLMAWTNPMVQAKFGTNEFQGALLLAMISLGLAAGRFLIAAVKFKVDDRVILAVSGLAGGTVLAIGLSARTYWSTLITLSIGGLLISATVPCILSLVAHTFGRTKARAYGYMEASVALAGLTGPSIVGALADSDVSLWSALWISPLAAGMLGFASLLWKIRQARRTLE
jgi:MFS family permease